LALLGAATSLRDPELPGLRLEALRVAARGNTVSALTNSFESALNGATLTRTTSKSLTIN